MINRAYFYYTQTNKSVFLSKNYLANTEDIPIISKQKICIFFSKKNVRSTILVFWFLFLILSSNFLKTKLIKPKKRRPGFSIKHVESQTLLYNTFDIFSFLDIWRKRLVVANLIYLKKVNIEKGAVSLNYTKILRPRRYSTLAYLDRGCDYYVSKIGFFSLRMCFNACRPTKLSHEFFITKELIQEKLEYNNDIYSHEAINFYKASLYI